MLQVTPVWLIPETEAANACDCPALNVTALGVTAIVTFQGEVVEGPILAVVPNPAYRPSQPRDLPGPDNAVFRVKFEPANKAAAEVFHAIQPASELALRPFPEPTGRIVAARMLDQKGNEPEQRVVITGLFAFFDVSARQLEKRATLRYGRPPKLVPIIAQSGYWGRIKAEIVCAMTSKYAMALYEQVQLRANLNRCVETIEIGRFRDILGVPPGTYKLGPDFLRFVIKPALLEVNGLSDMGVDIDVVRKHARAPVTAVSLSWWRKEGDDFRAAMQERARPKVGRMARLKGKVEKVEALPSRLPSSADDAELAAMLAKMREHA